MPPGFRAAIWLIFLFWVAGIDQTPCDYYVNTMKPLHTPERTPEKLIGQIQHYAWGGMGEKAVIPNLMGQQPGDTPWAELWLGIHAKAPAETQQGIRLSDMYNEAQIPWLLKILDAKQMLSVQVHPTETQAKKGYAVEAASGVNESNRNYKDPNPKPEIAIPLTEMWLMGGFLNEDALVSRFKRYDCLYQPFKSDIDALSTAASADNAVKKKSAFYEKVSRLNPEEVQQISSELKQTLSGQSFDKSQVEYWVQLSQEKYPNDVGVFSFFMFNLVHLTPEGWAASPAATRDELRLSPGEAFFTPAGIPHFYLEGACIEHMANSDNVLRAGFTHKHKDIDELLRVVDYRELGADALSVKPFRDTSVPGVQHLIYQKANNRYFVTEVVKHSDQDSELAMTARDTPQIGFVLEGEIALAWPDTDTQVFRKGESFLIPESAQQTPYVIKALTANSKYVKAGTPLIK